MAKQAEGFIIGTYDDITFYEMKGEYYARMKSSLTGQKFWTHRSFAGSRKSCSRFGRGNQLASQIYNEIPEALRKYALFCRMKSAAIAMIKAGKNEEQVINALREMKPVAKPKLILIKPKRISSLCKLVPFATTFSRASKRTICNSFPIENDGEASAGIQICPQRGR